MTVERDDTFIRLFHAFPRPRGNPGGSPGEQAQDASADLILRSILRHGFLCTPEHLKIYPHPGTTNEQKRALLAEGEAEHTHMQSRMCFTLCRPRELFERVVRGYVPESDTARQRPLQSHADLFGPFALAVDVPAARQIGILPATYYSPVDASGRRYDALSARPGLHVQIIQKLKELRDVSVVLAIVERSLVVDGVPLPSAEMLRELDIELRYQPEIMAKAFGLSADERRDILALFNTDRENALGLVGFIDMMLSLFQETDSHRDRTLLAFYQQREWRLIHHMRYGAVWYCLGRQPAFRNPLAPERRDAIAALRRVVDDVGGRRRDEDYFRSCWILETIDGTPLREFISQIIVPARRLTATRDTARRFGCEGKVIPAEDFGFTAGPG